MLSWDRIEEFHKDVGETHSNFLKKVCSACLNRNKKYFLKRQIDLYVYDSPRDKGIYSLCAKCNKSFQKRYGPSRKLTAQEVFVFLTL